MLVLTRRPRQSIWVGDAEVRVLGTDQWGGIRLGIDAPKHVPVHRDEIRENLDEVRSFANETETEKGD